MMPGFVLSHSSPARGSTITVAATYPLVRPIMLLASLSPVIVMRVTSGMAALIASADVWAVACSLGWGGAALVPAGAGLPSLLLWWPGSQATGQATTTAKQIGLSTDSEIM